MKPDEENKSSSAKPRGEKLDLIDEAGESDEEDEDLIVEKMVENKLFEQFASISGIDSSIVIARRNSLRDSMAKTATIRVSDAEN